MSRSLISSITFICAVISFSSLGLQAQSPKKSFYLQYEGYSSPVYKSHKKTSQYVPMSDGVLLAVDIFIPDEGPKAENFPVVFISTPYNRSSFIPKMGLVKKLASGLTGNGWGPVYDQATFDYASTIISYGYALVVADMRGTGASFGSQLPLMPQLGKDNKELIEWITRQSWAQPKVGMIGPSYLGWAQYMTAAQQPDALKCIVPEVIGFEMFTAGNRPGGIAASKWVSNFGKRLYRLNQSQYDFGSFVFPATPVLDEDKDGKLLDERPVKLTSPLLASADSAPKYWASNPPENLYTKAIREHADNVSVAGFLEKGYGYLDSHGPEPYSEVGYMRSSPGYYADKIAESGIPIYHVGGWFDGFTRGTTKFFSTFQETNPSKLFMAPRGHFPAYVKPYSKAFGLKNDYWEVLTLEQIRFMDHYLKGIDNGIDKEAPVYLYVMNEGWRAENEWPIKRQNITSYYLKEGNSLSKTPGASGVDTYEVDYAHSSSYGKKGKNRWLMYTSSPKKIMYRDEMDEKSYLYETDGLEKDTEVTGHPVVELYVSANVKDADVFVYLCDVDEKGKSQYVTEGQLRAGWHKEYDDDEQIDYKFEVKPDLPWHGYKKAQYDRYPFRDEKVLKMRFDMLPTSWVFKKGHKIRISIAGGDKDNFEFNPELSPNNHILEMDSTQLMFHRGESYPGRIELPIIPPK
ncbi:MAG: CocE/NonD family hydrolase [Bacteroidota bacterium]